MVIKTCSKCCEDKDSSSFHKNKGTLLGLTSWCKSCQKDYDAKRYLKNRKHIDQKNKIWRETNSARVKTLNKVWCTKNQPKRAAATAKRRAAKLERTAVWGNKFLIDLQYKLAATMTKLLRVKYSVDHIIPLQGKNVSGLHVHNNLQVIAALENSAKGNRY